MKRKKILQIFSIALVGATILTGVNALPANSASDKALANEKKSNIEVSNSDDSSVKIDTEETTKNASSEENTSKKSETTDKEENLSKKNETVHSGWVKNEDGKWNLYKYGKKVTGIYYYAPGCPLYFDENGVCATGWTKIEGQTYYFKETENGIIPASKEVIDGRHLNSVGAIQTGFVFDGPGGIFFYYDENGYECKGLTKIDGKMYYLKKFKNGYIKAYNETIDGNYFDSDGICQELSDGYSPDAPAIKNGWVKGEDGKSYYYEKGKMITGFYNAAPSRTYYFYESGASATGWTEIDGNLYYFKSIGDEYVMARSQFIDGYYLNEDGICDQTLTTKVKDEEEAINLIKENDSKYLDSLEKEFGSLDLVPSGSKNNTPVYLYSNKHLFDEPIYTISVNKSNSNSTIGEYFVGSITGKIYCYKNNFKLVYEVKNNEIVSTVYSKPHGPMTKFNTTSWR